MDAAVSRTRRQATIRSQYDRYLSLAEGRRAVAARFLKAAVSDAEDVCPDLFTPDETPGIGAQRMYVGEEL